MVFLGLFLIPALIAFFAFLFSKELISFKEFLLQIGVQLVVAGLSVLTIYHVNTTDVEIWNGTVTSKNSAKVSCSHSYSCNCRNVCSGSGKNRSCYRTCDTCYEHSYDVSWYVNSDIGSTTISRIDRRGLQEPPRYTSAKIGEPFSDTHSFENYIKASPDTLFRHQGLVEKYQSLLPKYPEQIYDYYRIDRFISVGKNVNDSYDWNSKLSLINRDLGTSVKVNMVLVLVFNQPQEYFYALEQSWIGGKKNDAILVIGVNDILDIQWVNVMSWSKQELFKVQLRDSVLALKSVDKDKVLDVFKNETQKGFVRRDMKDFEYLKASITPSTSQFVVSLIIGLIISISLSIFLRKEDVFNESYNRYKY